MIFSSVLYLFFIGLFNTLTTHTLLSRKKSIVFCINTFVLTTIFIYIINIYAEKYIHNPVIIEYVLYLISCLYLAYIHIVFKESISKKIFAMFSIWMFSTICLVISIKIAELYSGINDIRYNLKYIYIFRECFQILLLSTNYFFISSPYKKVLSKVSNKTIGFMSLYPVFAFLLLINNYTTSIDGLKSLNFTWNMLLLLVFIILGYVFVFTGISSASRIISMQYNIEKLEWISRSDPLTGLYNRRYIMEKIESEFISTKKNAKKFSLILADIDFFKKINDTFGHDCGDHVLKVVSKSLKDAVREQDFVSRWGGEEFLILLPETEIEGARILVERIKRIIEEQIIEYNGVQVSTTMTFGVTESQDYGMIEDIIKKADNALYEGKSQGRSCIILA
ncbi:GGDEF domain-containing protein [Desulfosporosinus sp. OT]|uniref:GGDEF domain-containing protein n=1 Tax=Desulfosporosinus sp. OT TaxID=913865 RepID=UPI000223B11A|nr:GGDEF domain-containing protein [Desulfosporosinus sp. OT]EGW37440.1 diguanylate cyclase domain protein [Desulfosporosinus sp. OT]